MNPRTLIIVCVSLVAMTVMGIVCAGFLFVHFLPSPMPMPPELAQPSVFTGARFLKKRLFFEDTSVGLVTDIIQSQSPGQNLGLAGLQRAVWVTSEGSVVSAVTFQSRASHVDFLDVDGDGTFEFLNRGGHGWSEASLIDSQGRTLWTCNRGSGVDDMAAGDVDGDGDTEFVVGYNGGGGVHLLNSNGRRSWRQSDGNVWHVEVVDTDNDGVPEIVHSNAGGQITVRDATGQVTSVAKPEPYFSHFSLCRWPTKDAPQRLLLSENDQIWLLDFSGNTAAQFGAPHCGSLGAAQGTLIQFREDQPAYLAVVVNFENWDRSSLYVYDGKGVLVYQEVIGESSASIAAVSMSGKTETLLLGGTGTVWEYSLSE